MAQRFYRAGFIGRYKAIILMQRLLQHGMAEHLRRLRLPQAFTRLRCAHMLACGPLQGVGNRNRQQAAHHGDGVEAAFLDDPEVFTLSLHMDSRYAYPFQGGQLSDTASAGNTSLNVPLPKGTHDAEYRLLFDAVWQPVLDKFQPDAIVLQAGTDMIFADPLGKLGISTQGFLATAQTILETCPQHADGTPRLLVTGGGGYHPLVLARAWAGLWALLSGRELPETLPPVATAALRAVDWDMDEDEPHFEQLFSSRVDALTDMTVRPEIADLILSIQQHPFLHTP